MFEMIENLDGLCLFIRDGALYRRAKLENWSLFWDELSQLDWFCENCGVLRPFEIDAKEPWVYADRYYGTRKLEVDLLEGGDSSSERFYKGKHLYLIKFECVTCKRSKVIGLVAEFLDDGVFIEKILEYPRENLLWDKGLDSLFPTDKDLFHKALICIRNGFGIGAFAYLRQPLERSITILLGILKEQAASERDTETIQRIDGLEKAPESKKIDFAKTALPHYLRIDGVNPLGKLYGICSEAIHMLSDEECLMKAREAYDCLCFLVLTITEHRKRREAFRKSIARLH